MANAFAHLTEVPLEKEVEKGADDRNGSYAANVFPARGNRGFDDVGSELEGQSFNEPATEAKPDKPIQYSDAGEQARSSTATMSAMAVITMRQQSDESRF